MKHLYTLAIATFLLHCSAYAQGWEEVGTGSNALKANNTILSLCYDSGTLYAGGQFKDASGYTYVAKWNGVNWEPLGSGESALNGDNVTTPICVDKYHNVYTLGRRNPLNKSCVMKWDGVAWSELGTGSNALNPNHEISAICVDSDGNVYAAGAFSDAAGRFYVAKWDGTSWSQLGMGINALNANNWIMKLAVDRHGNIYAGGWFTRLGYVYIAKWDGTTWSHMGDGGNLLGAGITSIYIDEEDNVYAGGTFQDADGRNYVAKWDGISWGELGTGSNALNALSMYPIDAITGDKAGNVYAAGSAIRQSTGQRCVKKWNGIGWSEVGTGSSSLNANGNIDALCIDTSGSLYAGGYFSDGVSSHDGYKYVAKFNTPAILSDISGTEKLHAWPNPAYNTLYVQGGKGNEEYTICDITGAVKKVTHSNTTGTLQTIDISGLSTGIYFLRSQNYIPFIFNKN